MIYRRRVLLEPGKEEWESGAVLNPTAIEDGGVTKLIYRAVKHPNFSSLGYAEVVGGKVVHRGGRPLLVPTEEYECEGVEDPRVTKIDGMYYLLYTAWDGHNARFAYAESEDLKNFRKRGIISPNISFGRALELVDSKRSKRYRKRWKKQGKKKGFDSFLWEKDAVLFPEKFLGQYAMLHRLEPDIQVIRFDDFSDLKSDGFWEGYLRSIEDHVVMRRKYKWESEKIGAGATPIKTEHGWLLLYHGVRGKDKKRVYSAGVALLDLEHPWVEIGRLEEPLFVPEFEWEKRGEVNNVVFPEGGVVESGLLRVYYGCADSRVGLAEVDLDELFRKMNVV